jgi:L-fuconolactonase
VVGWTEFAAPGADATIARLAADPLLVGLRPMVQDMDDDDWLMRAELAPAFDAMIAHQLVFDALLKPRHLRRLIAVLERYPKLRVVVDHAAKPAIGSGDDAAWRSDVAAVAQFSNVACKLSGLVTEAPSNWTVDDLRPYVEHLLTCFGAERLIWGSDWPVVNLAADYRRWISTAEQLMAGLDASAQSRVFGGNAVGMYLSHRGKTIAC